MKNDKNRVYGPLTKEDALYHNTELLLRNYREILWSIKMNTAMMESELSEDFSIGIGEYLNSLYGAGVTKYDVRLESQAKSLQTSKAMIELLEHSINFLRNNHPDGEEFYKVLYYSFLCDSRLSLEQILASLSKDGFAMCYRTFYRRRTSAIEKISALLWGAAMRQLKLPNN